MANNKNLIRFDVTGSVIAGILLEDFDFSSTKVCSYC